LTSDSNSDIDNNSDSFIMTPSINKPVLATITHLKPDCCPILEAGVITPQDPLSVAPCLLEISQELQGAYCR
jgi:hypothetical protein